MFLPVNEEIKRILNSFKMRINDPYSHSFLSEVQEGLKYSANIIIKRIPFNKILNKLLKE